MSTNNCLLWIKQQLTPTEIAGKRILEIGSYDVNGSVRPLVTALQPADYVGTDMRLGPGVDVVCPAESLVAHFGPHSFDVAISICAFEHIRQWQTALANMKQVVKPGGLILWIAPSHWPYHAYPHDYWRYSMADVRHIFSDCQLLTLEEWPDPTPEHSLVAVKCHPVGSPLLGLTDYAMYSVVTQAGETAVHWSHFFRRPFLKTITLYSFNQFPAPRWLKLAVIYVVMGVKLKLIQPIGNLWHRLRSNQER